MENELNYLSEKIETLETQLSDNSVFWEKETVKEKKEELQLLNNILNRLTIAELDKY